LSSNSDADEITAGQNERQPVTKHRDARELQRAQREADKHGSKKARLRLIQTLVHLRERAEEHENDGKRQQNNREPQRREGVDQPVSERSHNLPTG
jgi:hypothetical protein